MTTDTYIPAIMGAEAKTEEQKLTVRLIRDYLHFYELSTFSTDPQEIRKIQDLSKYRTCHVLYPARQIHRPEWQAVFPQATFYLLPIDKYPTERWAGKGSRGERWGLHIIEQGEKIYDRRSFGRFLSDHAPAVTDENRELVAQAIALIGLQGYLEAKVVFSPLEKSDEPDPYYNYDIYRLPVWTEFWGLKISFDFAFDKEGFCNVRGDVITWKEGEYLVPEYPNNFYLHELTYHDLKF